jgi:hypothetical protein
MRLSVDQGSMPTIRKWRAMRIGKASGCHAGEWSERATNMPSAPGNVATNIQCDQPSYVQRHGFLGL